MMQPLHSSQADDQSRPGDAADGKRILVVEDDPDICHLLELHLRDNAYRVDVVGNGIDGLNRASNHAYQLIVLDLMLPGLDGLELCRKLRGQSSTIPILMLTAKSTEFDRVLGLELGADDYLTKPFSILELQARVKAILRRSELVTNAAGSGQDELIEFKSLVIDVTRRGVSIGGQGVELTAREFDLLLHFARHPGRVFSRGQLLDQVWGYSHTGYEHTVNSHINRLRKKIEDVPGQPQYIETVWGVGYRFREN
ncbi:MAG: response regulator transcription factor [Gammaproteobacteria bacterium]|nr:response regulator transcription factor [Gammaproteobacteria bacterium]MDH3449369.1 response regulator transcription factor [Gammaproteobacteria bacterium]